MNIQDAFIKEWKGDWVITGSSNCTLSLLAFYYRINNFSMLKMLSKDTVEPIYLPFQYRGYNIHIQFSHSHV